MSVLLRFEGKRIRFSAGRTASSGWAAPRWVHDGEDAASVAVDLATQRPKLGAEEACTMKGGRVEGPWVVEGLVFDDEQRLERGDRSEEDRELREFRSGSKGEAGHLRFGAWGFGRAA